MGASGTSRQGGLGSETLDEGASTFGVKGGCMQILRVSTLTAALTIALVMGIALRATASDNWLIGTWTSATGLTYIFTADSLTITGPEGKVGPLKVTGYAVDGTTITVTADGLPAKAVAKKTDDTHAVSDNGVDPPITVTKT